MKMMMQFLHGVSSNLTESIAESATRGDHVDLKKTMSNFSMDALASCAFGVDGGSFDKTKESVFVKHASKVFGKRYSCIRK